MSSPEKSNHKKIVRQINKSYQGWIPRLYVFIRFIIIRVNVLSRIEEYLPKFGKILDIGCGFGLFGMFFKLKNPDRHIIGVDCNCRRISEASKASKRLNLENVQFVCEDINRLDITEVNAIVFLDLLHHISPADKWCLLETCYNKLINGGVLVIKDVTTLPLWKYLFNYFMDILVVGREPVYYLHHQDFEIMLERIGFKVSVQLIKDWLPYPHILLICKK